MNNNYFTDFTEETRNEMWEIPSMSIDSNYKLKYADDLPDAIDKLGELERIARNIGCPLEVRCKLYNGAEVYDKNGNQYIIKYISRIGILSCLADDYDGGKRPPKLINFKIEEYNKTWWLDQVDVQYKK